MAPNYSNLSIIQPIPTSENGYNGLPATSAQNIQMDANGNILFYIVDGAIYGKNGDLINYISPDGNASNIVNGENSEVVIIPDQDNCNLFHLLSTMNLTGRTYTDGYYAKLYIALDNNGNPTINSELLTLSNGDKIINLKDIVGSEFIAGPPVGSFYDRPYFAVLPPNSNGDYMIFIQNGQKIFRFSISNESFIYDSYFINFTTFCNLTSGGNSLKRGEFEAVRLANGTIRVAMMSDEHYRIGGSSSEAGVILLDANTSGVFMSYKFCNYTSSNFTNVGNQRIIGGIELTQDGNRIFVSHQKYVPTNSTLDYWDISGTPTCYQLSTNSDLSIAQIELAKDGNMYLPRQNYLAKISSINTIPSINLSAINIGTYPISQGWDSYGNLTPMRILQDQIDGSTVYDNVEPSVYHIVSYTITSNTTWDGGSNPIAPGQSVIHVEKELRIQAGVSATLKNLTFKFAPGAKLIVENGAIGSQGGKLVIDNTTLTNYPICGKEDMWLGVEVWGNSTAAQGSVLNSSQGVLSTDFQKWKSVFFNSFSQSCL